jgi:hypothetical protein
MPLNNIKPRCEAPRATARSKEEQSMADKREDHRLSDRSCCEGLRRCDFLSRSPGPHQAPTTGDGTLTRRSIDKKRSKRLSSVAGLGVLLVGTLSFMPTYASAQTAEELAKQYAREKMEQALQTKLSYDLYGVRFDLDTATIGSDTEPLLDDIATAMTNFPTWRLKIVGHTDSTGDPAHNEALSLARAEAIKAALIGRGVAVWRLETAGAGQSQPVAGNDTPKGQALNRRVELARLESEAANLMKAMSDYLAGQETISFSYDANLEVVTTEKQKLALASSGTVNLSRPGKIRATRSGGFANVESVFDGNRLTILGKNNNAYVQMEISGTIDDLIETLKDEHKRPLPAADLLLSDSFAELMPEVVDVKDLGSGVVGGTECDHLAFRNEDVDWQIWIAHGPRPYPCRYVITSTAVEGGPQYSVQISDWKTGDQVAADDYSFNAPAGATQIDSKALQDLREASELPDNFVVGGAQ